MLNFWLYLNNYGRCRCAYAVKGTCLQQVYSQLYLTGPLKTAGKTGPLSIRSKAGLMVVCD
jgi:hypothetical protein